MANLAGQAIKGYELLERIGAGGFGAVYRAYQSTVGREVAVKVILPGYANNPDFIRRFEMEAQLVARLEHLHIVPLYDFWRDPNGAYLVMRWLRGGSLKDALQEGPFDLAPAALLLEQVAAGLAAANSQGVIHCDLKPSNILLDEEGNAYLADFSIAKILRNSESGLIQKESIAGSLNYISPEQARGEPVTPQSDLYSLGVSLYETLTGQHPFPEMTPVQRLYKHLDDPLPTVENLNDAVQAGINEVIQKATAKDPKRRFGDALEMAAAFRMAAQIDGDLAIPPEALTPREEDILLRIVDGLTNKEIAQDLFIEVTTVKWYITQIYRKLGVRSRKQAIARVQEARLLAADEEGEPAATAVSVALPEPVNPYKGLRAFDISDARDFFGREAVIEKLIARLGRVPTPSHPQPGRLSPGAGRFLVIVGPSGSGKSSLVKAGLIPALRRGEAPGSDSWFIVQMVPGDRPLDQLEIALTRVAADQSSNLRRHLERDEFGLLRVADLILPQNETELLILLDQFEEAFTLVEDEAARAHFIALLSTAASDAHSRVRLILALRADYYDRPLHYPEFGELLRNHMETVLPLSAEELERAILRPAEQVGVGFEPGLVATIIDDVQYQPGALPLLQYALTELFEGRDGRTLTHAAYQAIGGTAGALARRAEEPYQEHEAQGREAIRQMFLRLVALDEDSVTSPETRQKVPRSELTTVMPDEGLMDEIIDTYAAYRLLTLDHDPDSRRPTVEIAHEALLREWKRLRGWLDVSREDLRLRRQLGRAAAEWRQAGVDASFLLRGTRLEQFETWSQGTELALTEGERDYLQASAALREEQAGAEAARRAREAKLEQRARRVLQALVVVFLLAAVISGWLALDANRQRGAAERNFARSESQRLAAEANNVLERGGSAELAALLALRGLGAAYTRQADLALQRAAAAKIDSALIEAPGGAYWPLVSPDNRYLRFMRDDPDGSAAPIIELWDLQAMQRLWQVRDYVMLGYPWTLRDFTADYSRMLAITSNEAELVLLDVESSAQVLAFQGNTANIIHPQLSADGTLVVAGVEDGSVHVWNAESGEEIRRFAVGGGRYTRFIAGRELLVAISPDNRLVVARAAGRTQVWDIESGEELYRFEHEHTGLLPPQFADEGRLLMAAVEPALSLWDLASGQEIEHAIPPGGSGVLSPDGRLYAEGWLGESNNEIALWEVSTGKALHRLTGHTDDAGPLAFADEGRQLVTWGGDGTARLWEVASGQELLLLAGHSEPILGADLSLDSRYLVTAGRDDAVRIWDLQAPLGEDNQLDGVRNMLHLSPDGRVALTADPETGAALLVEADSFVALHHLDFRLDALSDGSTAKQPFSSDSEMVLGVKNFETILVYDVASGELIGEYSNPDGVYRYAAFVPGGQRIFAGGDRGAYLLDAETGDQLRVFTTHDTFVYESNGGLVGVSPDGRYGALHVWTTDSLNVVYLWDLEMGVLEFQSTPHPNDVIMAFDFSEDSRYFAWGGTNNTAYVLDLQGGEEVIPLSQPVTVHGIDFSSDNRLLLTSSGSGGEGVTLWNLQSGEVVRRFYSGGSPTGYVKFIEADEYILYTTLEDGVIHRQPVGIDGLIESVCARLQRDLTDVQQQFYDLDDAPTCPKFVGS